MALTPWCYRCSVPMRMETAGYPTCPSCKAVVRPSPPGHFCGRCGRLVVGDVRPGTSGLCLDCGPPALGLDGGGI